MPYNYIRQEMRVMWHTVILGCLLCVANLFENILKSFSIQFDIFSKQCFSGLTCHIFLLYLLVILPKRKLML